MSLLGWRQWAVDREGLLRPAWTPWTPFPAGLLLWRPDGLTRAYCLRDAHATGEPPGATVGPSTVGPSTASAQPEDGARGVIPADGCVCGLYAWRDPETLAAAPIPRWTRRPIVTGAVRLGGRVIVGERGYRAEVGYPVAIHDPHGVIAPAYQVARYRDWRALVAEWRPEAPSTAA
ncbi:hypothetical protein [Pseudofrankia inefficax]|uniref:Uncharacterized protein n=1 Tax=Pseudofrankia inefficax (strain DSM 45817 / CECT 9037 / DDB 130130 / EuI1c) TaxID=298654 RepID=E3JCC5_PSEI1|nr:hypothetical protein [Pseudofrankia inefficax]ADP84714.1 hypothetical protein FraEuI1c_6745 [Pseudofrankia inefficax]